MEAFSAKNANLPRRMCERKVVTKHRTRRWIRIRQWADFRPAPGTHRVTGASLPKPQIISLCHVPPNSESGSSLLLSGAQRTLLLTETLPNFKRMKGNNRYKL